MSRLCVRGLAWAVVWLVCGAGAATAEEAGKLPAAGAQLAKQQPMAEDFEKFANDPKLFLSTATKMLGWNDPAVPVHIVGPIYFVGTKGLGSYLIKTSAGRILLCTGMPPSGPMIEESIRKLGFDPRDIKLILSCHGHIDHAGGHAYLKRISGAKVVAMGAEVDLLESGGRTDFHYAAYPEFLFEPVKVDQVLHDGESIRHGDVTMTARHTPGHTKGATTWIMDVKEDGRRYTVVFPDGSNINPGYRLAKNPSYLGIVDDYRRTFQTLEGLRPDIWLTQHTDVYDFEGKRIRAAKVGVRAWVDPEGYRKWLASQRAKFEAQVKKELEAKGGVPEEGGTIRAAVEAVFRIQEGAWNRGDIDAFMEHYWKNDDLTFSPGGKTTRGWQATRDRYRERYPTREKMGHLTLSDFEITPLGDSAALALGEWKLDRASEPIAGNFTLVVRKIDGRWVIVHDHTSRVGTTRSRLMGSRFAMNPSYWKGFPTRTRIAAT
jgi:metallo-beta-lactamase class B